MVALMLGSMSGTMEVVIVNLLTYNNLLQCFLKMQ